MEEWKMKKLIAACLFTLFVVAALPVSAQDASTLGLTKAKPTLEGVLSDKEYSLTTDTPDMRLGVSWTGDVLYVAVRGQTTGWVAVGIGSPKMNDAILYIGYAAGTQAQVKVQKGQGHRHGDVDSDAPLQYAMKEGDGATTLEVAVKAASFIADGQKQLDLIFALGGGDSFTSLHKSRYSTSVSLSR
jgi:hypothetical protein